MPLLSFRDLTVLSVSVPISRDKASSPGAWLVTAVGGVGCDPVQLVCLLTCSSRFSVRSWAPCFPKLWLPTRRAIRDWVPDPQWKPAASLPHSLGLVRPGSPRSPDGAAAHRG